MLKTTRYCDKCRKEITDKELFDKRGRLGRYPFYDVSITNLYSHITHMDFCNDCLEKFYNLMDNFMEDKNG